MDLEEVPQRWIITSFILFLHISSIQNTFSKFPIKYMRKDSKRYQIYIIYIHISVDWDTNQKKKTFFFYYKPQSRWNRAGCPHQKLSYSIPIYSKLRNCEQIYAYVVGSTCQNTITQFILCIALYSNRPTTKRTAICASCNWCTAFSNAFSWNKPSAFLFHFHCSLFSMVEKNSSSVRVIAWRQVIT